MCLLETLQNSCLAYPIPQQNTSGQTGRCKHTRQAIFSPSSVMHYRPPLLCRPWAGQRAQPAKYPHIYTHMQTVTTLTFLDHETRLDFQYGFIFQPSAPSFLPFCILHPVGVNVIRLMSLLSLMLFSFVSLSLCFFLSSVSLQSPFLCMLLKLR